MIALSPYCTKLLTEDGNSPFLYCFEAACGAWKQ